MSQPPPPDERFRDLAANERTMLAWIRTGIGMMAFGFAIARFGIFLRQVAQVAGHVGVHIERGVGSSWFGVGLVLLGLLTNATATVRYAAIRSSIVRGQPIPASPAIVLSLGIGSALVAAAMATMLARTLAHE
jgi:putative membrane protein